MIAVRIALSVLLTLACTFADAADAAPAKLQFPDGTGTPSELCGACHKALYQEFASGGRSDLRWNGMKFQPHSTTLLQLPAGASRSATAHALAGSDPFPLEARRVEEDGKECNVCHFPQPFAYPEMSAAKIEKAKPRESGRSLGVTCASCHLTPDGKMRGPYSVDSPHETVADERIQTSVACAMCHAEGERVVGKQTQTFLEWREDFYNAGLGKQQCQDCHMPRTVRKLAEDFPVPERVVARHTWTGGHSLQRVSAALQLGITQDDASASKFNLHVTNVGAGHSVPTGSNRRAVYLRADAVDAKGKVVARKEWMFAPWMLGRPDDRKHVEEDLKGPDPLARSQADAQGPHETTIRAGEERVLEWQPALAAGRYTVRATLVYDLNRYNDPAFKDDQQEIGRASLPVRVSQAVKTAQAKSH